MEYNRFFNIHIPKTGGTYFRENILVQLISEMNDKNIKTNPSGNGGEGRNPTTPTFHWCWYKPFITENTYIYTALRNPAKRIVSHYAWQAARAVAYNLTNYTYEDINKDNFYKWLDQYSEVYQNFQSKNLTYYNDDHSQYIESLHLGWPDGGVPTIQSFLFDDGFKYKVNHVELVNNVKRINLLIKSEDLLKDEYQIKVVDKICSDLGISNNINLSKKEYGNQNELSNLLFNSFSKREIEKLYEHSSLDSEIYFSTAYTKF